MTVLYFLFVLMLFAVTIPMSLYLYMYLNPKKMVVSSADRNERNEEIKNYSHPAYIASIDGARRRTKRPDYIASIDG